MFVAGNPTAQMAPILLAPDLRIMVGRDAIK